MDEADTPPEAGEISANDVIFECPFCTKSLAIDRRAAGMAIVCPDCGNEVVVPLAGEAGEAPTELNADQRIASLSSALRECHDDLRRLDANLAEVNKRRKYLETLRASNMKRMERIAEELAVMQSAIDRIASILEESTGEDLPQM